MTRTVERTVTLRPVAPEDRPFLSDLYASTREEELRPVPWDDATKRAFLEQQFSAQDVAYRANYPGASLDVIEVDGAPAGRLYLHRRQGEIRVMDIALVSAHRGAGIGTTLLSAVLDEARSAGRKVSIHVERQNPALSLYRRLGFDVAGEGEVYLFLEWSPEANDVR